MHTHPYAHFGLLIESKQTRVLHQIRMVGDLGLEVLLSLGVSVGMGF